jgi:hypothetical protein
LYVDFAFPQTLDVPRVFGYFTEAPKTVPYRVSTLDYLDFFREQYLTTDDLVAVVSALNLFQSGFGTNRCWCLKTINRSELKGFTTSHGSRPLYKGRDARMLTLAIAGQYQSETQPIIVRKHVCNSVYCINPNHYYFGTKREVCFERGQRKGSRISPELVTELRLKNTENRKTWSYAALARQYRLPYHVVRRICNHESYE